MIIEDDFLLLLFIARFAISFSSNRFISKEALLFSTKLDFQKVFSRNLNIKRKGRKERDKDMILW
jgi:hypothetical protein